MVFLLQNRYFIICLPQGLGYSLFPGDLIITGNSIDAISALIKALSSTFALKDLGPLSYFLGIDVSTTSDGLFLSQRKYTSDLLQSSNMSGVKPISTPISSGPPITSDSGIPLFDGAEYRRVVGALQYLTVMRPDINFTVSKVSQFMHRPTDMHWSAVKRILRYLKQSLGDGLLFHSKSDITLTAYSDAEWAGCPDD
ncbi:uncharacterized mitochondrial protein AtMg00810-like [Macadamia integrifolia]|uniref:uncharacterized mitochondrial protein AtMg00810-like n=1 Tax=Macadamia integrifolia TaxID=60698 RepID=UPI001C4F6687|nr:uncharacterized mitochondrial protein AtMg00810-like [Macadamia integrifolia]